MKKKIEKLGVLVLIFGVIASVFIINEIQAQTGLNLVIETNKTKYLPGEDIEVKIKLSENVMTASFYLNYNSSEVTYKNTKTTGTVGKDYPEDNELRVVYTDMSGVGTNEIILVFTVKEGTTGNASFSLKNTTMTKPEDNTPYTQANITGIDRGKTIEVGSATTTTTTTTTTNTGNETQNQNIQVENNSSNTAQQIKVTSTDSTTAKATVPQTGENDTFIILTVAFVGVTIYLGFSFIKLKRDMKF